MRFVGARPRRHLDRDFPNFLLHISGRAHVRVLRRGDDVRNASALDRMLSVGRSTTASDTARQRRRYAVIDVGRGGKVSVECRLAPELSEWTTWAVDLDGPIVRTSPRRHRVRGRHFREGWISIARSQNRPWR
jgi:hypothetical protein